MVEQGRLKPSSPLVVLGAIGSLAAAGWLSRRSRTGSRFLASEGEDGGSPRFGTFRLHSSPMFHAPSMVRLATEQYPSDPDWAIDFLESAGLHPEPAEALASKAVSYAVEDDLYPGSPLDAPSEKPSDKPGALTISIRPNPKKSVVVFTYWGGVTPRSPILRTAGRLAIFLGRSNTWTKHFYEEPPVGAGEDQSEAVSERAQEIRDQVRHLKSSPAGIEKARGFLAEEVAIFDRYRRFLSKTLGEPDASDLDRALADARRQA